MNITIYGWSTSCSRFGILRKGQRLSDTFLAREIIRIPSQASAIEGMLNQIGPRRI